MKPQPLIVRITAHIVGSKPDRDGMTELAELRDQVVIVTAERDRCHHQDPVPNSQPSTLRSADMTPQLDLDTLHLESGRHAASLNQFCVLEAVAYIAGEPWSDHPQCASPVISVFLRSWNDGSGDEQRQELKRYIPRLVNSRGTDAQESERSWMALDWLVRVQTPTWLRLAGLTVQADFLTSLEPVDVDNCPSILPALEAVGSDAAAAWVAVGDFAWDVVGDAVGDAARNAAWDAAWAAVRDAAGAAAWDAAEDAAWAAAGDAAWAAAWAAAGDAAWAAAWDAAWAAARNAAQDAAWDAAGDAARNAAQDAARDALAPTVTELRVSAHDLVDRMLAVTEA
jgi:hypothetical protein